ncbi:MAG: hypothetical protein LBQ31_07120 [Bacteroidales bacterium]|jgi:hypothetical protein|nr:hypothetical protein [Bacteroidales bacterium]
MNYTVIKKTSLLFSFILSLVAYVSCKSADVTPVTIHRYDKAIMDMSQDSIATELQKLQDEYWVFLQGADLSDTANIRQIKEFKNDEQIRAVWGKIAKTYYDDKKIGVELANVFDNTRKVFPSFKNPDVYTYISFFDVQNRVFYFDSILWIGLDLYVPDNVEQYSAFGIQRYISARLSPEYLMPDVARYTGIKLIERKQTRTLLDHIVADGKIICFMQSVLPDTKEHILLGYTPAEWAWCKKNEGKLWEYLAKENLIYESDYNRIRKFINDGPSGNVLEGAPARLSQFVGLRLVSRYLDNTDKNWDALFKAETAEVLGTSKYKP